MIILPKKMWIKWNNNSLIFDKVLRNNWIEETFLELYFLIEFFNIAIYIYLIILNVITFFKKQFILKIKNKMIYLYYSLIYPLNFHKNKNTRIWYNSINSYVKGVWSRFSVKISQRKRNIN